MASQRVRIGCSGWSYGDWRGGIYPEGLPQRRWLERYAEIFDTVEVNATFYRLPKHSMVEGWVEQVPGDFLFAVKASRYLTPYEATARDRRRGRALLGSAGAFAAWTTPRAGALAVAGELSPRRRPARLGA
ncbi:MAG TPA: DUF72 domain-containing protein [Solirubrobacterales bacterium]|nr:DUF72 domain-containing protein [Solirubrobacterales bacterium]